jgi:hypothetical protein
MKSGNSVLLSIFRRKGGEGLFTKVINDNNKSAYYNQLILLEDSEVPLLCYKQNELNWLILTTERILKENEGASLSISFKELIDVKFASSIEYKDGNTRIDDFTRLILTTENGTDSIIEIEKGKPYQGIFQVLHYLVSIRR